MVAKCFRCCEGSERGHVCEIKSIIKRFKPFKLVSLKGFYFGYEKKIKHYFFTN
jgi:hypothetical protein